MIVSSSPSRRRSTRKLVFLAAAIAALTTSLGFASTSHGAEAYTNVVWTGCSEGSTGGSYDAAGTMYSTCRWLEGNVSKTGIFVRRSDSLSGTRHLSNLTGLTDVAPSPDGRYLYTSGQVRRLVRQTDLSYKLDLKWAPEKFNFAGNMIAPNAAAITTDAWGDIYVSNGDAPHPSYILKYKPDGTLVTKFGEYTNTAEQGKFNLNKGIATTRDGRSIYVVEKTGGRVQQFTIRADGSGYAFTRAWGSTDATNCAAGKFAAPGDIGVDAWGFVYVLDTSCERVQKFSATGGFLYQLKVGGRSHRLAQDITGNVYIGEFTDKAMKRSTVVPGPWPALVALPKPPVASAKLGMCTGEDWTNGGGQAAVDGTVFVACKSSVLAINSNGTVRGRITLPTGARYYDVAPSPDQSVLYVTRVTDVPAGGTRGGYPEVIKLTRQGAAGSLVYTRDAAWKLANFTMGGTPWPARGRYIATDAWGDLYFSNGGWAGRYDAAGNFYPEAAPAAVVKYTPAGVTTTAFNSGDAAIGEFDVNMGIAVSRDGRTVWTIEHTSGRAQRFDWNLDGVYRQNVSATKTFGKNDTTCATAGGFAAPYDIGLDPWGYVYITNTGCEQVKKFTAAGAHLWTIATSGEAHGIAVDLQGNVYVPDTDQRLVRSDATPGPVPALGARPIPDLKAPTLASITVPAITTNQTINVGISATDDVTGVQQVRISNEDGNWGNWKPFAATVTHTLTPGHGGKAIFVQVKDGAGNISATLFKQLSYQPVVDTQDPVLVSATVPATNAGATINVSTVVTDDTGAAMMRFATEEGNFGEWVPYAAVKAAPVSAGIGSKGVFVQVKDAAGHESAVLYRAFTRTA